MELDKIVGFFCRKRNIVPEVLYSRFKSLATNSTRYQLWYYLHYTHGYSANKLSLIFNRNRNTIFRGIRMVKHHIEIYKGYKAEYEAIIKELEDELDSSSSNR